MRAQLALLACFLVGSAYGDNSAARSVRGIAEADLTRYEPKNGKFHCLNNAKEIPYSAVNDDYCDCDDGSDEPGTSACANGKFYCHNEGHEPSYILSPRVNDGICDPECCDGSDEYDGKIKCPDTCDQVGAETRKQKEESYKLTRQISALSFLVLQGARKKQQYIASAEQSRVGRGGEIVRLEGDVKELTKKYEQIKAQKEEAESLESELKGTEEGSSEQCERQASGVRGWLERILGSVASLKTSSCKDDAVKKVVETYESIVKEQEEPTPASEHDLASVSEVTKLQRQYNDIDEEKRNAENKLQELRTKETRDYGPDGEFEALDGKCFKGDVTEYTYEMCFYGAANQVSKDTGLATHLGNWESWSGVPNKYSEIKYTGGTHCWNGPARSLTVSLECGAEEEVLAVSEPNKCEYHMRLKTPAACDLGVLQEKKKGSGKGGVRDEL
ncbi:hypothetical protein HK097_007400 [Rhizophlyctis rosea]|uniref:Glucosidase 2 subunit beta n=1 Tax=Rhizophlyctis rosea TaxID=64517 RepID=A0AAD5SIR1_9FUNG|nr:hypothetical protein HK097_007400 [Rhizophlyctis rosea]